MHISTPAECQLKKLEKLFSLLNPVYKASLFFMFARTTVGDVRIAKDTQIRITVSAPYAVATPETTRNH